MCSKKAYKNQQLHVWWHMTILVLGLTMFQCMLCTFTCAMLVAKAFLLYSRLLIDICFLLTWLNSAFSVLHCRLSTQMAS